MPSPLQIAVQNSKILTDEMRQKLLSAEPRLKEVKIQQILQTLQDGEAQYGSILRQDAKQKQALAKTYREKIRDFNTHTIPAAMRSIESKDKVNEEEALSSLLTELDKT